MTAPTQPEETSPYQYWNNHPFYVSAGIATALSPGIYLSISLGIPYIIYCVVTRRLGEFTGSAPHSWLFGAELILSISILYPVFTATAALISIILIRTFCRSYCTHGSLLQGNQFIGFGVYSFSHQLASRFAIDHWRTTFLMSLYYRCLGAKVGSGCLINTTRITDCSLIEIGDSVLIGYDAVISPHAAEYGRTRFGRIIIGSNVTIGNSASIMQGAIIGDGVTVGVGAVVVKNSRLEAGGIYVGNPARLLHRTQPMHLPA